MLCLYFPSNLSVWETIFFFYFVAKKRKEKTTEEYK